MPEYKVKQGDCISSIAYRYGFFPDTIWNDPKNSELKQKRQDPNVLAPGDLVYIPDKRIREVSGATEQRHRFRKKGVPEKLVVQFKNNDEARANEAYVLDIDGQLTEGKTDGEGRVEMITSSIWGRWTRSRTSPVCRRVCRTWVFSRGRSTEDRARPSKRGFEPSRNATSWMRPAISMRRRVPRSRRSTANDRRRPLRLTLLW